MSNISSGPPLTGGVLPSPDDSRHSAEADLQSLRASEMEEPTSIEQKVPRELSEESLKLTNKFFAQLFGIENQPESDEWAKGSGMATLLALKNAFDQVP